MDKVLTFNRYDFTLAAGGTQRILATGEYFRIMSSTGAVDVTIDGVGTMPGLLAGQALKNIPFQALTIKDSSGAPNSGFILVASSEFQDNRLNGTVDLSAASLLALENIDLNAATQNTLRTPFAHTGSFADNSNIAINTATPIFSAAANANGAIILAAQLTGLEGLNGAVAFLAKATAPTAITDGAVIHSANIMAANLAHPPMAAPAYVPAGLGLWMYNTLALSTQVYNLRWCRYKLL